MVFYCSIYYLPCPSYPCSQCVFGPIVHYILALCTHSSAYLNCHCLVVYLNGPVHLSLFTLCLQTLFLYICWRPYHVECTGSLLTSEVKRHRARLVLGWGTAREHPQVLSAFPIAGCCCCCVHARMHDNPSAVLRIPETPSLGTTLASPLPPSPTQEARLRRKPPVSGMCPFVNI